MISTDAHAYSIDLVQSLPAVLSRFMALGVPLAAVVERTTSAPADFLGRHGFILVRWDGLHGPTEKPESFQCE